MTNRQPPKKNEIWQHFKHSEAEDHQYQIWDLVTPGPIPENAVEQPYSVRDVETLAYLSVYEHDGQIYVEGVMVPSVLYTLGFLTEDVWCRALVEFMATDERSETGWKFWKIADDWESHLCKADKPIHGLVDLVLNIAEANQ